MMIYLSNMFLFFLMVIPHCSLVKGVYNRYEIQEDLKKFNITCGVDSCKDRNVDQLSYYSCQCGIHCIKFETCCPDTPFAGFPQPKFKPPCRSVKGGNYYFMVDRCASSRSKWADLCNTVWHGVEDLQSITPVTSRSTSITYKNYYCFRCHESTNNFLYWTANFNNKLESVRDNPPSSLTYDKEKRTWMVQYEDEDTNPFPVKVSMISPHEITNLVYDCIPGVISDCSAQWSDQDVRNKCQSYMAIRSVYRNNSTFTYKNIHCALCNFESLKDISCRKEYYGASAYGFRFSFSYLLDINRSDGDLVGRIQRCAEDNLWDPYTKKCRQLSCAIPGSKLQNGKCVKK